MRQERPDERSPSARAAENYNPTGVTVGSFRLFPLLELDEVYNDNIYATSYGTPGLTSSFIQIVRPSLQLRSDWSNHMLNFFAIGAIGLAVLVHRRRRASTTRVPVGVPVEMPTSRAPQ